MVLNITKTLRDCVWHLGGDMVHSFFASSGKYLRGSRRVQISLQCMYSSHLTSEEVVS